MKYIIKEKVYPEFLEKRTKTKFLFFPKKMWNKNNLKEIRWLEKATWTEYYSDIGKLGKWKKEKWKD